MKKPIFLTQPSFRTYFLPCVSYIGRPSTSVLQCNCFRNPNPESTLWAPHGKIHVIILSFFFFAVSNCRLERRDMHARRYWRLVVRANCALQVPEVADLAQLPWRWVGPNQQFPRDEDVKKGVLKPTGVKTRGGQYTTDPHQVKLILLEFTMCSCNGIYRVRRYSWT